MKKNYLIAIFALMGSACSSHHEAASLNPVPSIAATDAQWKDTTTQAGDGSVVVTRSVMTEDEQRRLKDRYTQTELVPLPVDSTYNVSLFRIRNVPEYEGVAFVAPKLFAYGSEDGGRIALRRNGDGTVSLSFPVVLVDGATTAVRSPSEAQSIQVPQEYLIRNASDLRTLIKDQYQITHGLSPLPGCPKQFIIRVADREYDVTPSDLITSDYCEPNRPTTLTLRVPEADARYILQEALYVGAVDARAIYETRVAFATSRIHIEFDKAKVFQEIEAELGVKTVWADVDARVKVTNVMKRQAMKVSMQGEMTPILDSAVTRAMDLFFEPYRPEAASTQPACGAAVVCLHLNATYSREQSTFSFDWNQSSNALSGQRISTSAKLRPLQDRVVRIGDVNADGGVIRPMLRNDGSSIETGLTAVSGDLVELKPSFIIKEERELSIPQTTRQSNVTCLRSEPVYGQVCHTECECTHCPYNVRLFGEKYCGHVCSQERVSTRCALSEDEWIDTTVYSMGAPRFPKVDDPVGYMEQLFEGVALKFTWKEIDAAGESGSREATCSLSQFARTGDGKSLLVRIENRPGCTLFSANGPASIMMHVVNQIRFPETYMNGKFVHRWDGVVVEEPSKLTYEPRVDFAGTIAIKGYSFTSSALGVTRTN